MRFLLALVTLIFMPISGFAGPSVIEAYDELRAAGLLPDLPYELRVEGGRWVTTSPDWGTPMPVTVDGPAGYALVLDEGTGGGAFELQLVLWRQADDLPLLGVATTLLDGGYRETSHVRFFRS
jgi:hypothetical protein